MQKNKHLAKFEQRHLEQGEAIRSWTSAHRDKKGFEGVAIVTDRRMIYYRTGMMAEHFEPWPLTKISSVEARKGMLFFDVVLHTASDDLVLRIGDKKKGGEFTKQLQEAINAASRSIVSTSQSPEPLTQIAKLDELRQAGAITNAEYQAKKTILLDKL